MLQFVYPWACKVDFIHPWFIHLAVRDDCTEQSAIDISAASFHNKHYIYIYIYIYNYYILVFSTNLYMPVL